MSNRSILYYSRGSSATYVIVGIVLVAVVLGGVYLVQKSRTDTTVPTPIASNKPEVAKTPAPSQPTQPSPGETKVVGPSVPTQSGGAIPQTGPEDSIAPTFMFAILFGFLVAYIRSRQAEAAALHR